MEDGTARMASCEDTITTGIISSASVRPAARVLLPSANRATKMLNPRMPYTMDGTAARFWMLVCISSLNRLRAAYSSI